MHLVGLVLAALIGVVLGLLGGGGSVLAVPVFVYVLGFGAKTAVAMSLPVVGMASLAAAVGHWRARSVNVPVALLFGAATMTGAFAGARAAVFVSDGAQLLILATIMIVSAAAMSRGRSAPARSSGSARRYAGILIVGLAVGVLTGLVGIGGGFLIVPALVLLAGLPMTHAVGTSLTVIAMNAAAGTVGYIGRVDIPWLFVALFTAVAVVAAVPAARLAYRVPQVALRRAFAMLLLLIGGLIFYQQRPMLEHGARPATHSEV